MKILVCISNVPDTTTKIKFAEGNASIDTSGVILYFLSHSLVVQRQFIHPGRVVFNTHPLDSSTSHPYQLCADHFPQPSYFIRPARFCRSDLELGEDRFSSDGHLHPDRVPRRVCAGTYSFQLQPHHPA